jgi:hypothetical protein
VHGWSEWSDASEIKSTYKPDQGLPPTTLIYNFNVKIAWVDPIDNYEAIDGYQVFIAHNDYINFSEVTSHCDGTNSVVFELKACQIPLSTLMQAPFNLQAGDEVIAKFAAHNTNGWSEMSDVTTLGALIQVEPIKMAVPTRNSQTTTQKLVVDWLSLDVPSSGYATVNSFNLEWDAGSQGQSWSELVGFTTDSLQLTYSVVNGVTVGHTYQLRVRAKNAIGWGQFSDVLTIKAATWPENSQTMSTFIDELTGGIQIIWTKPYDNAQEITLYQFMILNVVTN